MTTTEANPPRTAKPGTLLSQWWTLGTIVRDKRATGRHVKVAWVIIDRFVQKKGNGRASLRYIQNFTGLNRHAVVKACRELTAWGYVEQRLGGGTRPSEYVPSWVTVRGSGAETLTTKPEILSGAEMLPTVGSESTPLEAGSGAEMLPESYLLGPADKPGLQVSRTESHRPPTAPDAAGLAPASPGSAVEESRASSHADGFTELWAAYGRRQTKDRRNAQGAYEKLAPDTDLHATMIAEAVRVREHYEAHSQPAEKRIWLSTWISNRGWENDLPLIHADAKSAAISKTRGSAKPVRQKSDEVSRGLSRNIKRFKITDHRTEGSAFADWFEIFTFEGEDGTQFTERMHVLAVGKDVDDAPDYYLAKKLGQAAFGKGKPIGEWIGRVIGVNEAEDGIGFHHLPEENPPSQVEPSLLTNNSEPAAHTAVKPQPTRTARPLTPPIAWPAWMDAELDDDAA